MYVYIYIYCKQAKPSQAVDILYFKLIIVNNNYNCSIYTHRLRTVFCVAIRAKSTAVAFSVYVFVCSSNQQFNRNKSTEKKRERDQIDCDQVRERERRRRRWMKERDDLKNSYKNFWQPKPDIPIQHARGPKDVRAKETLALLQSLRRSCLFSHLLALLGQLDSHLRQTARRERGFEFFLLLSFFCLFF